jgi:hypothetical protein
MRLAAGSGEAGGGSGALPAAFGPPGEGLERPGRAVLADFLAKVLKLAALRLADLCGRLDFEPLERQDVLSQARPRAPASAPASARHWGAPGGRGRGLGSPCVSCAAAGALPEPV